MGTSKSSDGPSGGAPLIPSWTQGGDGPQGGGGDGDGSPNIDEELPDEISPSSEESPEPELAQNARFGTARRFLSEFGSSGDRDSLRQGLGHYARRGLGGAGNARKRLQKTSQTAGRLVRAFESLQSGEAIETKDREITPSSLEGKSIREIGDLIIEAIRPNDGTQDSDANRESLNNALAETAEEFVEFDFVNVEPDQINFLVERYIVHDICQRIDLDVGQSVIQKAGHVEGNQRLSEMLSFVQEVVRTEFESVVSGGLKLTGSSTQRIAQKVIEATFKTFEGYIN